MKTQLKIVLLGMLIISGGFVIIKNTLDERDISGLNRDMQALYKDRLMAANYIYRMNDLLHKKRGSYADAVLAGKEIMETPVYQEELMELIVLYAATSLTPEEEQAFSRFRALTETLYLKGDPFQLNSSQARLKITRIDSALLDLRVLSDIQVKEASVLKNRSGDVLSRALLALRLEWVVVVLAALLMIVFFKDRVLLPSAIPNVQRN